MILFLLAYVTLCIPNIPIDSRFNHYFGLVKILNIILSFEIEDAQTVGWTVSFLLSAQSRSTWDTSYITEPCLQQDSSHTVLSAHVTKNIKCGLQRVNSWIRLVLKASTKVNFLCRVRLSFVEEQGINTLPFSDSHLSYFTAVPSSPQLHEW